MPDIEVHIDLDGRTRQVGLARRNMARGAETVVFEYVDTWLVDPDRFSIDPALPLTRGTFAPLPGQSILGSIGDSAPDTWGRRLMRRAERRRAEREGRAVRTLTESDYLLGVSDVARLGALRFRWAGDDVFQAPTRSGVPALIELGRLLQLLQVAGKAVLLSRRFDRDGIKRIPFLSAMAMTGSRDGETGSYPEIVDAITQYGAQAKADARALYRRVALSVLISNVDDHLRNHGFLRFGKAGWSLSPVYDLNPTPIDLKARVLTTNINLDEGTCSIDLLEEAAEYFGLGLTRGRAIIKEVATATATWRDVAKEAGARAAEVTRMASAFEHDDLRRALAL